MQIQLFRTDGLFEVPTEDRRGAHSFGFTLLSASNDVL